MYAKMKEMRRHLQHLSKTVREHKVETENHNAVAESMRKCIQDKDIEMTALREDCRAKDIRIQRLEQLEVELLPVKKSMPQIQEYLSSFPRVITCVEQPSFGVKLIIE